MAKTYLHALLRSTLLLASTTGSNCSAPCGEVPPHTTTEPFPIAPDAGADGGDAGDAGDAGRGAGPLVIEADGGVDQARCAALCGSQTLGCRPVVGDAGEPLLECSYGTEKVCSGGGRRHAGVQPGVFAGTSAVADYLAASAVLEASSVLSFRALRRELADHGAPRRLLRAVSRAARDETRHARTLGRLARRTGAPPISAPRRRGLEKRRLEEIARENAVEGCVFETYGALLAMWQGENVADATLRSSLRRLARDESRHGSLSWAMARWAEQRLDRAARARVAEARRGAVAELRRRVAAAPLELVRHGLQPSGATAQIMVDHLARTLWGAPRETPNRRR